MIRWPLFRRKFVTFRIGQFNKLHDISELIELPHMAIYHCLDRFQMLDNRSDMGPALDNPFINMNQYKMFICNIIMPPKDPEPTDICEYTLTKMILTNAGVMQKLQDFKRRMTPRVLWTDDIRNFPARAGIIPIVNYNPLFRARVMGIRRKVRFMNFLWAMILNQIAKAPDKQHFIHVPIESLQFEKKDFVRAFKKYDRVATKYPEVSTYLFLAHFYSILNKRMVLPKRGMEFEDAEDGVEALMPDPADYDPELTHKELLTGLSSYMWNGVEDQVALEALKDGENPYTVSIFEHIPPKLFENINFILTCGKKFVIYNLRDLKELNASGGALMRIIRHVNMLAAEGVPQELNPVTEEPAMVAESVTTVDETGEIPNQPSFTVPMSLEEREQAFDQDLADLDNLDKIIEEATVKSRERAKPLTPAQKEHVKVIGKAYKKLTINGKTFEQLLTEVPDDELKMPEVDIDSTEDGSIPKSATRSSTTALDITYIKKAMDRDIAGILTSFNKQGMFLVDFKETVETDELNEKTTYVADYEDVNHKKHKIKFSLPKVDERGRFKSNGSLKVMKKQRVSNPICKVSDTRVTLNSNYNKVLVERNTNVAHNFMDWFRMACDKAKTNGFRITLTHSAYKFPNKPYPFELTEIGTKFSKVEFTDGLLFTHVPDRATAIPKNVVLKVNDLEKDNGYWFGYRNDDHFFLSVTGQVVVKNLKTGEEPLYGAFEDFFAWLTGVEFRHITEYCDMTILNGKMPVILPLGYKYGLTDMLKYTGTDYEVFDSGARFERRASDIIIKFKDKNLVIHRTPRNNALIFGGLSIYDFSNWMLEDMDEKDVYYEMLIQKKLRPNLIKGIDALFRLFIDPVTRDVLREIREPTDIRDLILRAVTMLTTTEHLPAASSVNFRFRGVEQMTGILYNEMAKAFATYQNRSVGATNKFSMKDFQIRQRIEQDQLSENVSIINPLDDIKNTSAFSNAGSGGRSGETFRIPDRQFTEDSVGIVSEATVDNGKVGFNATLPANPLFANVRGMVTDIDKSTLKPENMLSFTSLVMPGCTNDDSKRANFASIQSSHVVPIKESSVSRVRTGFEELVAQRTQPPFAYAARDDGTITNVDKKAGVLTIRYKNGERVCLSFGTEFTNNSANGFYVDQEVTLNGFRQGDKFKRGDILTYNKQFFQSDPYSKQVRWKIGVDAKVAILDAGGTIEDASILTQPLCDRMIFNPTHVREVVLTIDTNVHKCVQIGEDIVSTEPLMVWDQSAMDWGDNGDEELAAVLSDLNKNSAKAEYTGTIAQVDVLYKSPISAMSSSMQKLVKAFIEKKNARAAVAATCSNSSSYQSSKPLTATDKVGIVELTPDTVIFRFYIKQNKGMSAGDKLFFDNCLKSVCSQVYPESIMTEDGQRVDAATSGRGILARIINSPFTVGMANSVLEKLEQNVLDVYDGKEPVDQNAQ